MFCFASVRKAESSTVQFTWDVRHGRLLVDDAGNEGFVGFGLGAKRGEDIGIGGGGLTGTKLRDGESERGEKLAVGVDGVGGNARVQQWGISRESARMVILVAVGRKEIAAIGGAVDGNFPIGSTTNRANFLSFSRTKAAWLALLTDWTSHE